MSHKLGSSNKGSSLLRTSATKQRPNNSKLCISLLPYLALLKLRAVISGAVARVRRLMPRVRGVCAMLLTAAAIDADAAAAVAASL